MFFAYDSYIFCKANGDTANLISNILQMYENASGQKINNSKSSVIFSCNTSQDIRESICNTTGFQEADGNTTYLGLLNLVGRNKKAIFGYIKSQMQKTIEGWDKKHLSKWGKELLIKLVSQAHPTYAMSIFLLPKQLCLEMESIMCRYWWRASAKKPKSIHWMSWDRLCARKLEGDIGI